MTPKEHLDNFLEQPDVVEIEEKYERIISGTYDKWQDIFYALITEISKDRKIFDTPQQQVAEYGFIRDQAELETDTYQRNLLVTALFDALMVEKIKTYSLQFDAPAILSDEIHDEYLKLISENEEVE